MIRNIASIIASRRLPRMWFAPLLLMTLALSMSLSAAEPAAPDDLFTSQDEGTIPAGHSLHGEAFNEGPRQKAVLIEGTGAVHLPVTSQDPAVQKFFDQGIGQLHGFWFFEAERSFRQAVKLDPDCAMAYWGMAQANRNNEDRAKKLIAEAVARLESASAREQMYIHALDDYLNERPDAKRRTKQYLEALEKLVAAYPEDLEAKAQLGYLLYRKRKALGKNHGEVDALFKEILDEQPYHPVHHYRIHLWDDKDAARALDSAAVCGESAPAIAHMWHMPGHIYSRLKRYQDAVWQQEASARVDHAQMIGDRVLPDQIHNYAHNNEWLIRNLGYIGRHRDAIDMARNMIELPRHPDYNVVGGKNSAFYGRRRLFNVLYEYELWQQLIDAAHGVYLEPTDIHTEQVKRLRYLGAAYARSGNQQGARRVLTQLRRRLDELPPVSVEPQRPESAATEAETDEDLDEQPDEPVEPGGSVEPGAAQAEQTNSAAAGQSKKTNEGKEDKDKETADGKSDAEKSAHQASQARKRIEKAIALVEGHLAAARGDYKQAAELLKESGERKRVRVLMQALAGEFDAAATAAEELVDDKKNQVLPLATLVEILWMADRKFEAAKAFNRLREISGPIQNGSPVFERLDLIAKEMDLPTNWQSAKKPGEDSGRRPSLASLGPIGWRPSPAPGWKLAGPTIAGRSRGAEHSLQQYRGRPLIIIFYLGHGCLHCAEQLQALAPMTKKFDDAGISLIAISSDDSDGLKQSLRDYGGPFPFPLVSNSGLDVFKAYRVFDDFEQQPLHGTFLVDPQGLIRWHDISYEPFMDVDFLLAESQRLMAQSDPVVHAVASAVAKRNTDPADTTSRRIDPSGIRGSLILGGGGTMPDGVRSAFVALAGGTQGRIVVLSPHRPQGNVWDDRRRLRANWKSADGPRIAVWYPPAKSASPAEKLGEAIDKIMLDEATGVWIDADAGPANNRLPDSVGTALAGVLDRDGVVGSPNASVLGDLEKIWPELPFVPTTPKSEPAGSPSRVILLDNRYPHVVGFGIERDMALGFQGREIHTFGRGAVTVQLAASEVLPAKRTILRERQLADLTALRRAARARTEPRFPPAKLAAPEVKNGSLIIIGGGSMPAGLLQRFIELAGGPEANIVVLPTASQGQYRVAGRFLEEAGADNVTVLTARSLQEVNNPQNLEILSKADALWFGGGRQWRFVDAYEGTKAEALFHGVLQRGGVIGGSSAGASIQAEYLARGNPIGNRDIMAEGYQRGFGFLKGVAIDQHFSQRRRFDDMISLVKAFPQLLGIGVDESTAMVVRGHIAEIVGQNGTHFYDATQTDDEGLPRHEEVRAGERYDLKARQKLTD